MKFLKAENQPFLQGGNIFTTGVMVKSVRIIVSRDLILQSRSTPDDKGYGDTILLSVNSHFSYASPASGCPNGFSPVTSTKWLHRYGWIATGLYYYRCIKHWKFGKCLFINEGGQLAARFPNVNHGGEKLVSRVYVHKGWTKTWRGSAGCVTVPPIFWPGFISMFKIGDTGLFIIKDSI